MNFLMRFICALAILLLFSACEGAKQNLGFTRHSPDEYTALEHAPLSLPPSYHLMPPQKAGEKYEARQRDKVKALLMGEDSASAPKEKGKAGGADSHFLKKATGGECRSDIRRILDEEAPKPKEKTMIDKALFWKDHRPPATIVDPVGERERIMANQKEKRPINEGVSKAIEPREKAPLEDLLN